MSGRTPQRILEWLDRACEDIEHGAFDEAEQRLARVRRKAPNAPELWLVEGKLASARGDVDSALAAFEKSAELDPDWAEPLVELAREELLGAEDADAAIELCELIREDWPDEPLLPYAVLIEALAYVAKEEHGPARKLLEELDRIASNDDPDLRCEMAAAWAEIGEHARAETHYRAVLTLDPEDADAHHALGSCLAQRGDKNGAIEHWLRTREIDLSAPREAFVLSEAELEQLAERTLRELPEEVRTRLRDVPIFVQDAPSEAQVREGIDPRLLGLFVGTPLPQHSLSDSPTGTPDAAILFLRNLESVSDSRDELIEQVRITILHETAHFFGLDDDELDDLGLG